jgi:dihydrofolate reductase
MAPERRIVVCVATSADGFMARKDGSLDWLQRPRPKGKSDWNASYRSIDACLLGRKTYDVSVHHGMPEPCVGNPVGRPAPSCSLSEIVGDQEVS